jgi:hypothetical protein
MDRGFYSEENINAMLAAHLKFLLGVKVSLTLVQDVLTTAREKIRDFSHYDPDTDLYAYSETMVWHYVQERPYKGDRVKEERRMYLHLYFSGEKALEDERKFNVKLLELKPKFRKY